MKICIVGGGTTGWWAAGYLEHHFPDFSITLIESPIIPKIGVGESSLPQIKSFFDSMGIQESEWMSQCHAVKKTVNIKQGWDHCEGLPFHLHFGWIIKRNLHDGCGNTDVEKPHWTILTSSTMLTATFMPIT